MDEDFDISNADFWKKTGDDYIKQNRFEDAIKSYKGALEIDPRNIKVWNNLGYAYSKFGQIDEAKKCKEKIEELKKLAQTQNEIPSTLEASPSTEPTKQVVVEAKNPGIAALCSFFMAGLGQVYNGEVGKAVAILIGFLIGLLIFIIPGVIVWIFGIYDAFKTAKKMNSGEIPLKSTNTIGMIIFIVSGLLLIIAFFAAIIAAFVFGMAGATSPS